MSYEVYDQHGGQIQKGAGVAISKAKHGTFLEVVESAGRLLVKIERGAAVWLDDPAEWGLKIKQVADAPSE